MELGEAKAAEVFEGERVFYIFLMFGVVLEEKDGFDVQKIMKESLDSDSCVVVANCPHREDQLERLLLEVDLVELQDGQGHPRCMLAHLLPAVALPVVMREDVFIGLEIFEHGGDVLIVIGLSEK